MKLENIENPLIPENDKGLPVFAYPTIKLGERVKMLKQHLIGREEMKDKIYTVNKLYLKNLEDMAVYIVKFKETGDGNPYLAHHFYTVK